MAFRSRGVIIAQGTDRQRQEALQIGFLDKASIKLKVALATTALWFVLIVAMTALLLQSVRADFAKVLAAQQTSLVSGVARELDGKLAQDLGILARSAATIPPQLLASPDGLRARIDRLTALRVLFDDVLVMDLTGQVIADVPALPGRTNVNVADRWFFRQVMANGRPVISEPILGKQRGEPIVNMGAPIFGESGATIGVLTGVLRLQKSNVLGDLAAARIGVTGHFILIARSPAPVYVIHPDKTRVLQERAGGTRTITRGLTGFEGTVEDATEEGVRALFTTKSLRATDWLLVAVLPAAEAFAPIEEAERRAVVVAGVVALAAVPCVWLLVYGLLAPLSRLRTAIPRMRAAPEALDSAPALNRADEIGDLARAINLLLAERGEAERRQQESESRFEAAAASSVDAFFLLDAVRDARSRIVDFVFRFANAQALKLLGLSSADVVGRRLCEVLPVAHSTRLFERYASVVETGEPFEDEFEVPSPDVLAQWLHQKAVRAGDCIAVTTSDISRRHRREEWIQSQRTFLQTLIDNIPVGVDVRSMRGPNAGQVVLWNKTDEIIYGVSTQSALGKTARELLPADAATRVEARDRDLLDSPTEQEANETIEFPGRGARTLHMIRAPVFGPDDKVDYLISITTDVTREHRRADELRLASKVFETTADAIVLSDAADRVIMVNPAFTRLTGFTPAEMVGRVLADSPFRALDPVESAQRMGRQRRDGFVTAEVKRYRKDGTPLHLWVTASFVKADDGRVLNNVRVFTDISELKATQSMLEQLATTDVLTGLPNRRVFEDRLRHALSLSERSGRGVALLFIDLDALKSVNDTFGHDIGDGLLKAVAARLAMCVRSGDSLCRLGGDEFTVVLEDGDPCSDGPQVAQRLLDAFALPFIVGAHTLTISASIGFARFPDDALDAAILVARADAAMYAAKKAGGNRYCACDELSASS